MPKIIIPAPKIKSKHPYSIYQVCALGLMKMIDVRTKEKKIKPVKSLNTLKLILKKDKGEKNILKPIDFGEGSAHRVYIYGQNLIKWNKTIK